ncbi:unnamed protein product, partial [Mesorhabditis belari]|uniref:Uncharacterized protein n=1 Tax=Mesorhabditis belari TaxID=2138241 RepID=A0AAF3EIR9_9BILA
METSTSRHQLEHFLQTLQPKQENLDSASLMQSFHEDLSGTFNEFESTFQDVMTQSMIDDNKPTEKVKGKNSTCTNSKL